MTSPLAKPKKRKPKGFEISYIIYNKIDTKMYMQQI